MRLLTFDPFVMGHHLEHLDHLSSYVVSRVQGNVSAEVPTDVKMHMAVHPRVEEHGPELVERAEQHSSLSLYRIADAEYEAIKESSGFRRGQAMWAAASRAAQAVRADHCLFMEVNFVQPLLGLPRARRVDFDVSGILFFPFCRIEPRSEGLLDRAKAALERFRKYLQLKWVLQNSRVCHLFVINDPLSARRLQELYKWHHFSSLPDPVVELTGSEEQEGREALVGGPGKWPDDRVHVTLFGSLREGKGVRELIQAARRLPESVTTQMAIHLIGAPREDLEEELPGLVRDLRDAQSSLLVHYEGRFVSDAELHAVLSATDVIAAPYQRTEGSSGILSHAANYECPVIGPNTGLVGELIEQYEMGLAVDATQPSALAKALRTCVHSTGNLANRQRMRAYACERTPDDFAASLLNPILREHRS